MADSVARMQDNLALLADLVPPSESTSTGVRTSPLDFRPKNEADYFAVVHPTVQRRTRNHDRLIREVGQWLQSAGAEVATPHPIDLYIEGSPAVIVEAELVHPRGARAAIRKAVGQLDEYRYFRRLREAALCVLLDEDPGPEHIAYVEEYLGLLLAWSSAEGLVGGPQTAERLSRFEIRLAK
jgi:hypothetical protein